MRSAWVSRVAAAGCVLGLAAPGAAQGGEPVCRDGETLAECQNRVVNAAYDGSTATRAAASAAAAAEGNELQEEAAGPDVTELARSAIRDFLPRFAAELLTTDPTSTLTALNLRFNAPFRSSGLTVQGSATLHEPEIFAPLLDSIPSGIRRASQERLAGELEDGDDATLMLAVNLENRVTGRAFGPHQPYLDSLARALRAQTELDLAPRADAQARLDAFYLRLITDPAALRRQGDPECAFVQAALYPIACLTAAGRAEFEGLLDPFAKYIARRASRLASAIESAGFDRLSDLVNNQPQLNFGVEYRSRLGVVGPNEWQGHVRWEVGGSNMNKLRGYCAGAAMRDSTELACLRRYTRTRAVQRSLSRGERGWVEGVVRYRPDYSVTLAEDSAAFAAGEAVGFGIGAGYGAYVGSHGGADRDRVDLHVAYDFARADDLRRNRLLAGLFYTLRISGSASGVVGLTWANRPELLDAADRRLGARIGLSYKFNRGSASAVEPSGES